MLVEPHGWTKTCVVIDDLTDDVSDYLYQLGVASRKHPIVAPILERDLILNRLQSRVDVTNLNLQICPLHRYTFGIGWLQHDHCHHPDHNLDSQRFAVARRQRSASRSALRVAPWHVVEQVAGFPYGGRICDKHRKHLYRTTVSIINDVNLDAIKDEDDEIETVSNGRSFGTTIGRKHEAVQDFLVALGQSPIKSRSRKPLDEQTPGAVRRLVSKLRQTVLAAAATFAAAITPNEVDRLIDVSFVATQFEPETRASILAR